MKGEYSRNEFLSNLQNEDGSTPMLLSILTIPTQDYRFEDVWTSIRLSHSTLRLTQADNQLVFLGTKIGEVDMGLVVTINDRIEGQVNDRGVVYVNRFEGHCSCGE